MFFFLPYKKKKSRYSVKKIKCWLRIMYFIVIRKTTTPIHLLDIDYKQLITLEKSEINPHLHIVMDTTISKDTLRKKLSKIYTLKHQVHVSSCNSKMKSINYILKEFNILHNSLLTEDELQQHLDSVQEYQHEKEEAKNNYVRYLINTYKNSSYHEKILKEGQDDYAWIEYSIMLFLLETVSGDYKGFDKVILNRWKNAIHNHFYKSNFISNKLLFLLPNNIYAENYNS